MKNKSKPDNPLIFQLMTQPRVELQGRSRFPSPVIISLLCPVQRESPQMPSTSPAHLSTHSTPLFVFTTVRLRHDYSHPSTHPSIITLQQWTRAELSEDSVTVHNGLMADAVREFTGTLTQTDNTHTEITGDFKRARVGYNLTTHLRRSSESQTDDFK